MAAINTNSDSGFFRKFFSLLVFAVNVGLVIAIYKLAQAQDLSDISGYDETASASAAPARDLEEVLKKAIEGDYAVTITEAEINQMLHDKLVVKQAGSLEGRVMLKRVLVRLNEGVAEVIVVRDVSGITLTTSMYVQVVQIETHRGISTQVHLHGGGFNEKVPNLNRGGRFGGLTVPQGFLVMLMPEFTKIAEALKPEIDLGFRGMAHIKIKDNSLVLDPRAPVAESER